MPKLIILDEVDNMTNIAQVNCHVLIVLVSVTPISVLIIINLLLYRVPMPKLIILDEADNMTNIAQVNERIITVTIPISNRAH